MPLPLVVVTVAHKLPRKRKAVLDTCPCCLLRTVVVATPTIGAVLLRPVAEPVRALREGLPRVENAEAGVGALHGQKQLVRVQNLNNAVLGVVADPNILAVLGEDLLRRVDGVVEEL